MFGRVRASPSPSPLDSLETPPSKIIKDDSLSIYEATLMKLKKGSQRHLIPPPTVTQEIDYVSESAPEGATSDLSSGAMSVEATCSSGTVSRSCQDIPWDGEAMVVETNCCSASVSNSSSDFQSTGNLNSRHRNQGVSILYLFSKFKGYQRTPATSHEEMMIENDSSASFSGSSSSSECQPLSSAKEQGNHESSTSSSFSSAVLMQGYK